MMNQAARDLPRQPGHLPKTMRQVLFILITGTQLDRFGSLGNPEEILEQGSCKAIVLQIIAWDAATARFKAKSLKS